METLHQSSKVALANDWKVKCDVQECVVKQHVGAGPFSNSFLQACHNEVAEGLRKVFGRQRWRWLNDLHGVHSYVLFIKRLLIGSRPVVRISGYGCGGREQGVSW